MPTGLLCFVCIICSFHLSHYHVSQFEIIFFKSLTVNENISWGSNCAIFIFIFLSDGSKLLKYYGGVKCLRKQEVLCKTGSNNGGAPIYLYVLKSVDMLAKEAFFATFISPLFSDVVH